MQESLDRNVCGGSKIGDPALEREGLEVIEVPTDPRGILLDRSGADRQCGVAGGFDVDELCHSGGMRGEVFWIENLEEDDFIASVAQPCQAVGESRASGEEIADEYGEPTLSCLGDEIENRLLDRCAPPGFHVTEVSQDLSHLTHAVTGRESRNQVVGEWKQADAIEHAESKIRLSRGEVRCVVALAWDTDLH